MWTLRGKFSVQWIELTYAIALLLMGVLWLLLPLSAKHGAPCCRKLTIYRPLQLPLLFFSSISSLRGAMQSGPENHLCLLLVPCCWQPLRGHVPSPTVRTAQYLWCSCPFSIADCRWVFPWLLSLPRNVPLSMLWFKCWRPSSRFSTSLCSPFPLGVTNERVSLDSTDFAVFCSYRLGVSLVMLAVLHPNNHLVMTPAWWTETSAGVLWIEIIAWKQVTNKCLTITMRLWKEGWFSSPQLSFRVMSYNFYQQI